MLGNMLSTLLYTMSPILTIVQVTYFHPKFKLIFKE